MDKLEFGSFSHSHLKIKNKNTFLIYWFIWIWIIVSLAMYSGAKWQLLFLFDELFIFNATADRCSMLGIINISAWTKVILGMDLLVCVDAEFLFVYYVIAEKLKIWSCIVMVKCGQRDLHGFAHNPLISSCFLVFLKFYFWTFRLSSLLLNNKTTFILCLKTVLTKTI